MSDKQKLIDTLNRQAPPFLPIMGGKIIDIDSERHWACFEFNIGKNFCHSIDIVQGGFVTAMLDAAMAHALFASQSDVIAVSSLEIKTSFLNSTRAGKLRVEGEVIKNGFKTAFLEGRLYNEEGTLCATASSVAKVGRKKSEA
ncbi:MAG: PaaI family thioesterase [Cellvibrionaceae bacterium]|nr:PaaI family thioesterase [Cellvibrionaceae bacterium]